MEASGFCRHSVCPPSGTTHLGHLVTVEVQREAGTVVVQVAGARQAQRAGEQGLLRATLPPGRAGGLQALARGLLLAPLPWRALGTEGVGPAGQQARLVPTPHLGHAQGTDAGTRRRGPTDTHGHHAGEKDARGVSKAQGTPPQHGLPRRTQNHNGPPPGQGWPEEGRGKAGPLPAAPRASAGCSPATQREGPACAPGPSSQEAQRRRWRLSAAPSAAPWCRRRGGEARGGRTPCCSPGGRPRSGSCYSLPARSSRARRALPVTSRASQSQSLRRERAGGICRPALEARSSPRPHRHAPPGARCPPPTILAPWAGPAWRAAAVIAVDLVHTRGPVGTRRGLALVDVCRESAGLRRQRGGKRPHAGLRRRSGQERRPLQTGGAPDSQGPGVPPAVPLGASGPAGTGSVRGRGR